MSIVLRVLERSKFLLRQLSVLVEIGGVEVLTILLQQLPVFRVCRQLLRVIAGAKRLPYVFLPCDFIVLV